MSRHYRKLRRVERTRLQVTASALGDLLGWHSQQADTFFDVLASSPWRHCRRSESEWVLTGVGELRGAARPNPGRRAAGGPGSSHANGQ